jgi:uncharacterized protein
MEETVAYARERARGEGRTIATTVYTNGTLMDPGFFAWVRENDVRVIVSLDGPPAINDRARVFAGGQGSSRRVLANIRAMMSALPGGNGRTVTAVTSAPTDLLPLAKYFRALGFNTIQIQAAYGLDGFAERGQVGDIAEFLDWYCERLIDGEILDVAPFSHMLLRLARPGKVTISWYPCNAGANALGVAPDGTLYPCHHFLEEEEHSLGNVADGIPAIDERRHLFRRVDQRDPCKNCWARHACGGECYHRASTAGAGYFGTMPSVCSGRKTLIGMVLEAFARVAAEAPEALRRLVSGHLTLPTIDEAAYLVRDLSDFGAAEASTARRYLPVLSFG